jgi:hypothetical protein
MSQAVMNPYYDMPYYPLSVLLPWHDASAIQCSKRLPAALHLHQPLYCPELGCLVLKAIEMGFNGRRDARPGERPAKIRQLYQLWSGGLFNAPDCSERTAAAAINWIKIQRAEMRTEAVLPWTAV